MCLYKGELYKSLMRVALKKQDEIKLIIQETIVSEEESVLQCASGFQFTGVDLTHVVTRECFSVDFSLSSSLVFISRGTAKTCYVCVLSVSHQNGSICL